MSQESKIHEEAQLTLPTIPIGDFLEDGRHERGPQGSIYSEALHVCRMQLANMLIEDDFDSTTMAGRMRSGLEEIGVNSLVQAAAMEEVAWSYRGTKLLDLFGVVIERDDYSFSERYHGPMPVFATDEFADDLFSQVANLEINYGVVNGMHDVYARTDILKYFQFMRDLNLGEQDQAEGATDQLFELSEKALFNADFTLPLRSEGATYLLCYVPHRMRQIFKQIIAGNQILQRVDVELGPLESEDDVKMRDALMRAMRGEALTGQTWNQFCEWYGVSEATGKKIALLGASTIDAQADIQQLRDAGKGLGVISAFEEAQEILQHQLERMAKSDPARVFTNTDTGHGLNSFRFYSIDWVTDQHLGHHEFTNVPKDGTTALIFEDDLDQAKTWARMVQAYSPSTIEDGVVCETMADFSKKMQDPNIGLYLIDINNPEGQMAGIEIADRLVRLKDRQFREGILNGDRLINIIVWSTSPALVRAANDYFKPRVTHHEDGFPKVGYSLLGSGHGASRGVYLTVKPKEPDSRDFNDLNRRNKA